MLRTIRRTIPLLLAAAILGGLLLDQAPFRIALLLEQAPDQALAMPVETLRVRQIGNTWHAPRSGGRAHEGQDLFARRGTPVYSATDGIVIHVGHSGLGGNSVSVLGAGRRVYYYAHLLAFADGIHIGSEVTQSSLLGLVGNTGNARTTPPHLHFGVYGPGGAINPLPLLVNRSQNGETELYTRTHDPLPLHAAQYSVASHRTSSTFARAR